MKLTYIPLTRTPKVGERLFSATYSHGIKWQHPVEVLEVTPAVCKVRAIEDDSEFQVHVALLSEGVQVQRPVRPLPKAAHTGPGSRCDTYTAEQMVEYARQCVADTMNDKFGKVGG